MNYYFFLFYKEKVFLFFFFFFSSRRRHTRCSRDWSSDVCSSDLGVGALQAFHATIAAAHPVLADLAWLAAGKSERPHAAVAGQDGAFHSFKKSDGAADAIAGIPFSAPAGAGANMEILQHDRIAEFQHLRIGEARVRHVGVYRIGAGETRPRRRARTDRLIILVACIAEVEIVHGA